VNVATKWELKRQASYDTLVTAAASRFHDDGYAATRVEDIVEGTGYSKGAFYFHFANKLECFWHVVDHRNAQRGEWWHIVDAHDPATTSLDELLATVFGHFEASNDGMNRWILVMVDFHQQHRQDPEVQARVAEIYDGWVGDVESFVRALQAGGWIDPDVDPQPLARQVFAYSEGIRVHSALYDMGPDGGGGLAVTGVRALLEPARTAQVAKRS
jgi:TetR/AcrR family transcriptional repressor of nem operon